jgi:hypothetical protein
VITHSRAGKVTAQVLPAGDEVILIDVVTEPGSALGSTATAAAPSPARRVPAIDGGPGGALAGIVTGAELPLPLLVPASLVARTLNV